MPNVNNMNNIRVNKFVLNDMNQDDNDNKIIKELAAELEQSTAKKIKKIATKNVENIIQKIEPINLINNINNIEDDKKEFNKNNEIQYNNSFKIENKIPPKKIISNNKDVVEINSPTSINSNFEKNCNLNSEIETNTETINSKIGIFCQKLTDIEAFMKNKFIELTKQINDLRQENLSKKQNLNRTTGFKSDKNIFNFMNNENCSNNYSLSIREENPNLCNYRVKSLNFILILSLLMSAHLKKMIILKIVIWLKIGIKLEIIKMMI